MWPDLVSIERLLVLSFVYHNEVWVMHASIMVSPRYFGEKILTRGEKIM